ncbi:MAG: GcrA family cell cycle regulator [Pseudomonadota bacterium]
MTDEIITLYASGLTMAEVGRRLGFSESAVGRRLAKAGVSVRPVKQWPAGAADDLKAMYLAGKSASQCALAINDSHGLAVTRNAVIGKVARMGLVRTREAARIAATVNRPKAAKPKAVRPVLKIAGRPGAEMVFDGGEPPPPKARATEVDPTIASEPRNWTTRRFGECAWPVDGSGADTRSCCNRALAEKPYCREHAQVAYQQPQQGKKKASASELARSLRRYL